MPAGRPPAGPKIIEKYSGALVAKQRLEVILSLTRDLGVNLAGVEIILNMREKMEEMGRQVQEFASYVTEQMGSLPREPPPSFSTSLIPFDSWSTIDGKARLKIPPATDSGKKFRLRERGVLNRRTSRRGDQFVEVRIVVPAIADQESKASIKEFGKLNPEDPRQALWAQV